MSNRHYLKLFYYDCNSGATFLSPSLGRALSDCERLFMGPQEGTDSLPIPGENL